MSFCSNCGSELTDGTAFCPNCGAAQVQQSQIPEQIPAAAEPEVVTPAPVYQQSTYQQNIEAPAVTLTGPAKIFSIISMVCGLASIILCCSGPVFGIAAIIFSSLARQKTPSGLNNTMARVGLITGIIGTVLGVIVCIAAFIFGFIGGYTGTYNSFYYMY